MSTKSYFRTLLVAIALLTGTVANTMAQTGTLATMTTTESSVKITAYWTGDGSILANGMPIISGFDVDIAPDSDGSLTLTASGTVSLTGLWCIDNSLTSLDVSNCTKLVVMYCSHNSLTSLDVSGCTEFTQLFCNNNSLTSLDVSGCTELYMLYVSHNSLTTLDVSKFTKLNTLACHNNSLTSLDVSGLTELTYLFCGNNSLTTLNLSGCTELNSLNAENQAISVTKSGDNYTNPVTYTLPDGSLQSINVGNSTYAYDSPLEGPTSGNTLMFATAYTTSDENSQPFSGILTLEGYTFTDIEQVGAAVFSAYPNPTDGMVTVTGLTPGATISIYSAFGALVATHTAYGEEATIDLSSLASGTYILNVNEKTLKVIRK